MTAIWYPQETSRTRVGATGTVGSAPHAARHRRDPAGAEPRDRLKSRRAADDHRAFRPTGKSRLERARHHERAGSVQNDGQPRGVRHCRRRGASRRETSIAASAKPGLSTIVITSDGGNGKRAQATLTLTGLAPLRKAAILPHQNYPSLRHSLRSRQRAHSAALRAGYRRRRGAHARRFIALRDLRPYRFRRAGQRKSSRFRSAGRSRSSTTSSTRYGIARSRLVARGYGLTRPVASNATESR